MPPLWIQVSQLRLQKLRFKSKRTQMYFTQNLNNKNTEFWKIRLTKINSASGKFLFYRYISWRCPKSQMCNIVRSAIILDRQSKRGEINIRIWESVWGFFMPVWEHGVPGLALYSRCSDGSCATITLAFASVALLRWGHRHRWICSKQQKLVFRIMILYSEQAQGWLVYTDSIQWEHRGQQEKQKGISKAIQKTFTDYPHRSDAVQWKVHHSASLWYSLTCLY